uniref:Reactive oxygen species modulator 1 n=1 Tax=Rattus norvegicus TaxID=10116 RepID=A0A8I5YC97_RAT
PSRLTVPRGCFDHVRVGFVVSFAVGMVARALFGTFSCLRIKLRGWELSDSIGETPVQSDDGPFGTLIATGMGT